MGSFNYYIFELNGKEIIYYTYVTNSNRQEILEWAERFRLLKEEDFPKCKGVRTLSNEDVEKRNRKLYKEWWEERERRRLAGEDVSSMFTAPRIGDVQLD